MAISATIKEILKHMTEACEVQNDLAPPIIETMTETTRVCSANK